MDMGRKFFAQALKSDPDMVKAQKALKNVRKAENLKTEAGSNFKAGKLSEAIGQYSECLTLFPANASYNATIHMNRALAHAKQKSFEAALDDLNEAIKLKDDYGKAFMKRAEIHQQLE